MILIQKDANCYLAALASFVKAASLATTYVEAFYSPEELEPPEKVLSNLDRYFDEYISPSLRGLGTTDIDRTYWQYLSDCFSALVVHLDINYRAFYAVRTCGNGFTEPSYVARTSYDSGRQLLSLYLGMVQRITFDRLKYLNGHEQNALFEHCTVLAPSDPGLAAWLKRACAQSSKDSEFLQSNCEFWLVPQAIVHKGVHLVLASGRNCAYCSPVWNDDVAILSIVPA